MNARPVTVVASADLGTSAAAALYTSPTTGRGTLIDYCEVCNHDSTARTVTVYLASDGAAAGSTNTVVSARSVAPGETWLVPVMGAFLPAGGKLYAIASSANTVAINASGRELTDV